MSQQYSSAGYQSNQYTDAGAALPIVDEPLAEFPNNWEDTYNDFSNTSSQYYAQPNPNQYVGTNAYGAQGSSNWNNQPTNMFAEALQSSSSRQRNAPRGPDPSEFTDALYYEEENNYANQPLASVAGSGGPWSAEHSNEVIRLGKLRDKQIHEMEMGRGGKVMTWHNIRDHCQRKFPGFTYSIHNIGAHYRRACKRDPNDFPNHSQAPPRDLWEPAHVKRMMEIAEGYTVPIGPRRMGHDWERVVRQCRAEFGAAFPWDANQCKSKHNRNKMQKHTS